MTSVLDSVAPAAAAPEASAPAGAAGSTAGSSAGAVPPGPPSGGPPRARLLRFADSLGAALDSLVEEPMWALSPAEQADALVTLTRTQARLAQLRGRVLVAADRNEVGAESGATSTAAWLAHRTRDTRAGVFADLHLARDLEETFAATGRALSQGTVNTEQARVIVAAVKTLTTDHGDQLPPGTTQAAEEHLLELAAAFDAPTLRRLGKRLFEVVCPDAADEAEGRLLAKEEAEARRQAHLSLRDNGDGTSSGRFKLPTLHAAVLRKALEALTSPRRIGEQRLDPRTGKKLAASTLLGHGLMDLIENHLDLDALPGSHGSPFTLVVTLTLQGLLDQLGGATLEGGERISAGQARRLACRAGIIPLVLGGDSMPLDVGREQRLHTRYQRIAAHHRHRGCAASNCDRPPSWVELHHEIAWADGGRTDLEHALPLCPPHHHMADHPNTWTMTRHPDGSVRFTRRQ